MQYVTVTLKNALDLLQNSTDFIDINNIVEDVASLTKSNIDDHTSFSYNAKQLEKVKGNAFMIKVLKLAEQRVQQVKALWMDFQKN